MWNHFWTSHVIVLAVSFGCAADLPENPDGVAGYGAGTGANSGSGGTGAQVGSTGGASGNGSTGGASGQTGSTGGSSGQAGSTGGSGGQIDSDGGLGAGGGADSGGPGFPPAQSFDAAGPFATARENNVGPQGAFTLFRPEPLGANGVRHPIVTWGNGTFATPDVYAALLTHLASHGFVVIASNSTQTGSGQEMLAGARWLVEQDGTPGSPFQARLDTLHIGAIGHSQGGGGAIAAGADPLITTTVPIQPGPQGSITALKGPMFLLGGGRDTIVSVGLLVTPRFEQATVPTFYGILESATHFEPPGDGGGYRGPITAWFRMQFLDEPSASAVFHGADCGLCTDPNWTVQKKNFN